MLKRVAIVGGGLGGLTAALRLARAGYKVSLFEKNHTLGGKMNQIEEKGFRFDTGPSLLTMPFIIDELFQFLGCERKSFLTFNEIDPICRYFWQDGSVIDASMDYLKMRDAIKSISPEDAQQYKAFLEYSKTIYEITADVFLYSPVHEIRKIAHKHIIAKLAKIRKIDPFRTVHDAVCSFFIDKRIIQLFDRYATYNGSNPYQSPATLNIIPYVEFVLGSFYIKGGMFRLIKAMTNLAKDLNVEIHLGDAVEKILYHRNQVKGLKVKGEKLDFDYVVCNADVVIAHQLLIDSFDRYTKKLNNLEPSMSGLVFLWGMDRNYEQLKHHNIFFSRHYKQEFERIFKERKEPDDPTIYISITSKSDSDHAPANMENWFVLLNMPYLQNGENWSEKSIHIKDRIIQHLKRRGVDVQSHIIYEKCITPSDFYQNYQSNKGSIYGISSNSRTTAFRRPPNRSRKIKGLYFVGGSTHPGGGIPLVMLSAKMVSEMILENERNKR